MNLWDTRSLALQALEGELKREREQIDRGFQLLEYLSDKLYALRPRTPFVRVCGLTAAKCRNLLHCCYSLNLDGHGQEAGATARVLIESIELLTYFIGDASRADEAIEGRLPSAGKRARKIGARTQQLREHWNDHASHFSVSNASVAHMINFASDRLVLRQPFKAPVLRENLRDLFVFLFWGCLETLRALRSASQDPQHVLVRQLHDFRDSGNDLFDIIAGPA